MLLSGFASVFKHGTKKYCHSLSISHQSRVFLHSRSLSNCYQSKAIIEKRSPPARILFCYHLHGRLRKWWDSARAHIFLGSSLVVKKICFLMLRCVLCYLRIRTCAAIRISQFASGSQFNISYHDIFHPFVTLRMHSKSYHGRSRPRDVEDSCESFVKIDRMVDVQVISQIRAHGTLSKRMFWKTSASKNCLWVDMPW